MNDLKGILILVMEKNNGRAWMDIWTIDQTSKAVGGSSEKWTLIERSNQVNVCQANIYWFLCVVIYDDDVDSFLFLIL